VSARAADAGAGRSTQPFLGLGSSASGTVGSGGATRRADASTACGEPPRQIDVIFIIDTSGSMAQEIVSVQQNINASFARILDQAKVDYRVILLGTYGISDDELLRICISDPLSRAGCSPLPDRPQNSDRFFHYSTPIGSLDSFCQILDTLTVPDEFGLAPSGWSQWLRAGALKIFVEVTDDTTGCASTSTTAVFPHEDDVERIAATFDSELRRAFPLWFEKGGERNYQWFSIVGMARSAGPTEPLVQDPCATAPAPGLPYQALSRLTGSMRYPVCEGTSFPDAFRAIASEVMINAVPCQRP
jgi:hypothetical protein